MGTFELIKKLGHESVVFCQDPASGYYAIIAIHSTVLGPAVGGTRVWPYASGDDAIMDALRLSRGMTYKNAVAGLDMGGGKAVIVANSKEIDREKIFRAHGRFIDRLGGNYITAEDVGTSPEDMEIIAKETKFVAGLATKGGDPSPYTGRGVFRAIQAAAKHRWGKDELSDKTIAIQGCGHVGYYLARELHRADAKMVVTDVDSARVQKVVKEFGATAVEPDEIYKVRANIFAPCALGAIINDKTIPQLNVEIVAGGANNQLLEERHGAALAERGILYAPDYVVNGGGIISGSVDLLGWSKERMESSVENIYDTLLSIFRSAEANNILPFQAADRLAEERIRRKAESKKAADVA
ncbi:MAG TPA: Glu/Leu/Phe/Val dehydrogenase dimerization domain-containing protein [Blastocatellia bacterium]|nr:Glu/Leu/Phe/Val dehydrogenase dimerization domain-containing protein [Blastocatellia bacterium]